MCQTDKMVETIEKACLTFNWGDFGLDDVELAESEDWATSLAWAIHDRLLGQGFLT